VVPGGAAGAIPQVPPGIVPRQDPPVGVRTEWAGSGNGRCRDVAKWAAAPEYGCNGSSKRGCHWPAYVILIPRTAWASSPEARAQCGNAARRDPWRGSWVPEVAIAVVVAKPAAALPTTTRNLLLHLILNTYWEPLDFELPPVDSSEEHPWRRWLDTALDSPHDIVDWQMSPPIQGCTYRVESRSVVALVATITPQ